VIVLPAGRYLLTRAGRDENAAATGDLDVRDDVTITGADVDATIVDGNDHDRVFEIFEGVQVSMRSLTIQRGADMDQLGGGGGIRTAGRLVLESARVTANRSSTYGGGIMSRGELFIQFSRIDNNQAWSDGGIGVFGGTTRLEHVAIFGNAAMSYGGGIANGYGSVLQIASSGIWQNSAGYRGGGLLVGGHVHIVNSTISRNSAREGGGIWSAGYAELASVTFKDNDARVGAAILRTDNVIGLRNTVLGESTGGGQNCSGTIVSRGYNLDHGTSCGFRLLPDYEGLDTRLGELANNGGFTLTNRPLPGSPAIDIGPADCPGFDQRDVRRPADGDGDGSRICDRGAVELEGPGR
jgi:hypothetical protein